MRYNSQRRYIHATNLVPHQSEHQRTVNPVEGKSRLPGVNVKYIVVETARRNPSLLVKEPELHTFGHVTMIIVKTHALYPLRTEKAILFCGEGGIGHSRGDGNCWIIRVS